MFYKISRGAFHAELYGNSYLFQTAKYNAWFYSLVGIKDLENRPLKRRYQVLWPVVSWNQKPKFLILYTRLKLWKYMMGFMSKYVFSNNGGHLNKSFIPQKRSY